MKILHKTLTILAIAGLCFCFTACDDDSDNNGAGGAAGEGGFGGEPCSASPPPISPDALPEIGRAHV